jgi:hypothetical protein
MESELSMHPFLDAVISVTMEQLQDEKATPGASYKVVFSPLRENQLEGGKMWTGIVLPKIANEWINKAIIFPFVGSTLSLQNA